MIELPVAGEHKLVQKNPFLQETMGLSDNVMFADFIFCVS